MSSGVLLVIIVGCEIAFWVFLLSGLVFRYVFGLVRLSSGLLIAVPFVDILLLGATIVDLGFGSTATFAHGLAAAYIGFSIAFGKVTIQWADTWFAHKYAGGPAPGQAPTHGWELFRSEMVWWLRCVLSVIVTQALVLAAILLVDEPQRTAALDLWLTLPLVTAVLWFIFGPLWVALFNRKAPQHRNA